MRIFRVLSIGSVFVWLSLSGCIGSGAQATPTALPQPTMTPIQLLMPTVTPEPLPPTPLPSSPDGILYTPREGGALGQIWNLADFRYAFHADRLRVVLEMRESAPGVPQYHVVEVENAAVPFPAGADPAWGAARIDLVVSDLYARDVVRLQTLPVTLETNPVAARIGLYPTYDDATFGLSIGLHNVIDYQVHELRDPVRIVIDVEYP